MTKISANITKTLSDVGIKLRPNANHGLWLVLLLPISVIACHLKYQQAAFEHYKLCAAFSLGTLITSIIFIYQCNRNKELCFNAIHTTAAALTCTIVFSTGQGFLFSLYSGTLACLVFFKLYSFVLRAFPQSFSIGEASIVSQATVLFIYASSLHLYNAVIKVPTSTMNISTTIIQIGLLGFGSICSLAYWFKSFRKPTPFYTLFIGGVFFFILVPLHIILKRSALLWILELLIADVQMIKYIGYVMICCIAAVFAISNQIRKAKKASTISRKIFHVLAFMVYFPGLQYECMFLYLASAVTLGIFIFLETLRILNIPPLGATLQDGFSVFCDEKDVGPVALTPIYLLVSVSLPLWLHPAPCDMTDSAGYNLLPLLSGLLSIGIGDSAASFCGKLFGRHRWPGTHKTVEGTIGSILSQVITVYILIHLGFIKATQLLLLKTGVAIISTSLIEAFTSQVDNLALPLLMFIILL